MLPGVLRQQTRGLPGHGKPAFRVGARVHRHSGLASCMRVGITVAAFELDINTGGSWPRVMHVDGTAAHGLWFEE